MSDKKEEDTEPQEQGVRGQASKDMSQVHDMGDDNGSSNVDELKLTQAMNFINDTKKKTQKSSGNQKIILIKEHVELLMKEFDIPKVLAEKTLRDSEGNVKDALRTFLTA